MTMYVRRAIFLVALCAAQAARAASGFDSGGTMLDQRRLQDADRSAYHGRFTQAIAKAGEVIGGSPNYADAIFFRAGLLIEAGRYKEAASDLDRVAAIHPDSVDVAMARAQIALRQRDGKQAMADFNTAMTLPGRDVWARTYRYNSYNKVSAFFAYRSIAQELVGNDPAALGDLKLALDRESERPWYMLARHCYVAAVAGLLNMAELTCGEAIERDAHDIGQYDSMGLVHLKMKQWDKAVADYDKALYYRSDLTLSVYGRGIAKRARGDKAGGDADIAAATRDEPDIANIMTRLGVPAV